MGNKNRCSKCGERHLPPTGKKCKYVHQVKHKIDNDHNDLSNQAGSSTHTKAVKWTPKEQLALDSSSEDDTTDQVQLQILKELRRLNQRLDVVEEKVQQSSQQNRKEQGKIKEQSELNSVSSCTFHSKKVGKNTVLSSESSDSEVESIHDFLRSLSTLRSAGSMQKKVDDTLRQIEDSSGVANNGKIKSKCDGPWM